MCVLNLVYANVSEGRQDNRKMLRCYRKEGSYKNLNTESNNLFIPNIIRIRNITVPILLSIQNLILGTMQSCVMHINQNRFPMIKIKDHRIIEN